MDLTRPDISQLDSDVRAYIEALEAEIERLRHGSRRPARRSVEPDEDFSDLPEIDEPAEPPTTINVITATVSGIAKRTPRHHYIRQRRGGMGIFDLETSEEDPPDVLALADEGQNLLLLTNQARAFRLPVSAIAETPVRSRGESIVNKLNLLPDESIAVLLPDQAQGYVAMISERGFVRMLRHHVFGEYMKPGTTLYDSKANGLLVAACWTPGDADLFIATRQGKAIRFSEKLVPPHGGQGIRINDGDVAVGITSVDEDSGVFLLAEDGKGTIRRMDGFSANKSIGAGGKLAMNTEGLIGATAVRQGDDLFIISGLSKIIRFSADDVPAKEGVVQGVICMSLRADETTAFAVSPSPTAL